MKLSYGKLAGVAIATVFVAIFAPNVVLDCTTGEECERKTIFHAPQCSTIEADGMARDILKKVDFYTDEEGEFCRPSPSKLRKTTVINDAENYITAPLKIGDYQVKSKDISLVDPWSIDIAENGEKIITEQRGSVKSYNGEDLVKEDSLDAVERGNGGLMGAALHPNYTENSVIYLYYTYDEFEQGDEERIKSRLSRFEFTDRGLLNEKILLNNVTGGLHHSGGRVEIGPDKKIYLTTGDAGTSEKALEKNTLLGKTLRINLDGSIPQENPFGNEVYSYGHRNPQGIDWGSNGSMYVSEHGDQKHDEVNLIEKGGNYGWPTTECGTYREENEKIDFNEPVMCFEEWTMAPSGITFVDEPGHPWDGNLFVAGLRGEQLHRLEMESGKLVENGVFYINKEGERERNLSNRLRDVDYHNGSLWVIGDEKGLVELSPN